MTDSINTYNRPLGSAGAVNGSRSAQRRSDVGAPAAEASVEAGATGSAVRVPQEEQLELSPTARRSMSDPSFDRAKVEAIKTALRDGTYPLDSRKIAESFVALERLIDD